MHFSSFYNFLSNMKKSEEKMKISRGTGYWLQYTHKCTRRTVDKKHPQAVREYVFHFYFQSFLYILYIFLSRKHSKLKGKINSLHHPSYFLLKMSGIKIEAPYALLFQYAEQPRGECIRFLMVSNGGNACCNVKMRLK